MSRSIPDPLFAAAARAEVERRVRASAGPAGRRTRRPWVMELTAIAAVAAVVAGVAVGISALRPSFDGGGAPAGSVTRSTFPTAGPSPLFTEPSTAAPSPTRAPTTAPPVVVAPPPTEAPTTPPTSSAPTSPPPATSSTLIGPTGAEVRSSAEIRAWALSLGNGDVWAEQAVIVTSCMADHGFLYDPEFDHRAGTAAQHVGLTDAQYEAFDAAHYGPKTDLPYTWQTAGCDGLAVHRTGQDDAN